MRWLCGILAAPVMALAPTSATAAAVTPGVASPPATAIVHSESVVVDPIRCAELHAVQAGCVVVHRWWGVAHQAASRDVAVYSVPPGYWYWTWTDQECNGIWPVCGIWTFTSTEDGIANGTSIVEWNHGCTPGGFLTSVGWCGYLYNGGANVGNGCCEMQFGLNGDYCIASRYGGGCINHGMRRWVWADGKPGSYSAW